MSGIGLKNGTPPVCDRDRFPNQMNIPRRVENFTAHPGYAEKLRK